ncbi:putative two-component sensor histidine kinase/response regulator hybrid protein [Agrobacterium sp. ATCC 31749]|uniref:hybrid sensor histidine kinase/response regulator n=1 Tax=unclassified Agrobacterium TaxID=2632611 RepID=UPI00020DBF65|nr:MULTISPECIES: PAS domain-containing sensor histidine kinase [unclassified Agrobacterium]EGL62130.1 putative two-component sensor histidine kinase/response regulator hybrid protein [Agrobacterium sp. ATCC 31749]
MQARSDNIAEERSTFQSKHQLLVEAITDYAIYMLDRNGIITSWNAGAERFKGYTEDEIIGEHFSRFYTPEDIESGLPTRALAIAAEAGRFENEGWRVRKDGKRFWAHVIIDPVRSREGELIGFAKITRDLTERKAAEVELKRSEHQFRLLVQGVTDYAIYLLDPEGNVTNWNVGAQRIKGYEPQEIIGSHFSKFYTPEDLADDLPRKALAAAERDGRFEKEGWRVRKDGTRFWASVVIDAIHNDDGSLFGFAKVTRDITEKREAQNSLDRTREELFQAQKMEVVGQLAGGMAHDFNNLLMAILGSLEILRKRIPETPETSRLLDNAVEGAQRGAALTQRMLAFSRRQELKFEPVDVLDLVRSMTDLLQRTLGPSILIETRFPLSLPKVWSGPNQLATAILNLAVNARDAMPSGGALIFGAKQKKISDGELPDLKAGSYLCFSVQDEGAGMDADTLAKAATPFFTTKGVGKGTGLGLSMVQGLLAQSAGRLTLKSKVGIGTTVELWLRIADASDIKAIAPDQTSTPISEQAMGRSLTVLAVDDDPLVLMNTVLMLEDLGHTVLEAASAEEALAQLRTAGHVDLVVTDHAMPRMTGAELAQSLQKTHPDLPVVIATGYSALPNGQIAGHARLSKPFSQVQLDDVIRRLI